MSDIFGMLKSVQEVSVQGMRSGAAIERQKFAPLIAAAKKAYRFVLESEAYSDGNDFANRLANELDSAIYSLEEVVHL